MAEVVDPSRLDDKKNRIGAAQASITGHELDPGDGNAVAPPDHTPYGQPMRSANRSRGRAGLGTPRGRESRGHLFVVQADLSRIAADAFLIPCDEELNVAGGWRPFLEPGSEAQPSSKWFKPQGVALHDGLAFLADPTPEGKRMPDDVVGLRVLVDTVGVASIAEMVDRSVRAVSVAAEQARHHGGRSLPLVAVPILGVGQGNFPGQRAEVVRDLVGRLRQFVASHPIDVALVLRRTSDYAAAQWARKLAEDANADGWPDLTTDHLTLADRLGEAAARGELSVFAGAGVSKPVGFPDWQELLQELAGRRLRFRKNTNYPRLAQRLNVPDLNERVVARFRTRKHALGHALLADLRVSATVTTNYDPCLENACVVIHREPSLQVLARQLAVGGQPWLLKLHGDVESPSTIVLTADQYKRLKNDHSALRGLVQSLMLTSHLLFVGFGFADDDFLEMSQSVAAVRQLAVNPDPEVKVGTAIELRQSADRKHDQLAYHHLAPSGSDVRAAARLLEILLDRLAWRCQTSGDARGAYLLDPDYEQDATEDDRAVREALFELGRVADAHSNSAGHKAVKDLLEQLGYRPEPIGRR